MIFAAMAMFVAGILEIYRKKDISIIGQKLAGNTFNASSISVFAQVPQFTLIGASEVFTSISGNCIHSIHILTLLKPLI